MPIKISPFSYEEGAPAGYTCGSCGAHGVKLWREYQTFVDYQHLYCAKCAVAKDGRGGEVDEHGKWCAPDAKSQFKTDQIGWRVPAVPTVDGKTFWGYTSVPRDGVAWWKRLPTR